MSNVFAYAQLENEQKILNELKKLEDGVVKECINEAMIRGGELVAQEARIRAPVGTRPPRKGVATGRLRKSIKVVRQVIKRKKSEVGVYVEADYPENAKIRKTRRKKTKAGYKEYYAFALEYGTHKMGAQPFLNPALEAKAKAVQEEISNALNELCRETNIKI